MKKFSIIFFISLSIMTMNFLNAVVPWYDEAYASSNVILIGIYGNNDRINVTLQAITQALSERNIPYSINYISELIWQNTMNFDILITDADLIEINSETYPAVRNVESHGVLFLLGNSSKFLIDQPYPIISEKVSEIHLSNSSGEFRILNSIAEQLIYYQEFKPYYSLTIKSEKLYTLEGRIYSESSSLFSQKIKEIFNDELFQSILINQLPASNSDVLCGGDDWIIKAWYVYIVIIYDGVFYKKNVAETRGDWIVCQLTKSSLNYNWFLIHYKLWHAIYKDGYSCDASHCGWFVNSRDIYSNYNLFSQAIYDFDPQTTIGGTEVSVTLGIEAGKDGISGGASATWSYPKPDVEIYAYVYPASNTAEWYEKLKGPDYTWWPIVIEPAPVARTTYRSEPGIIAYSPKSNPFFIIKDATDNVTLRYDVIKPYSIFLIIYKYTFTVTMKWPYILTYTASSYNGNPVVKIKTYSITNSSSNHSFVDDKLVVTPLYTPALLLAITTGIIIGLFLIFKKIRIKNKNY